MILSPRVPNRDNGARSTKHQRLAWLAFWLLKAIGASHRRSCGFFTIGVIYQEKVFKLMKL